jgi:DNA-binding LacI/PurR family transcriptional regulator
MLQGVEASARELKQQVVFAAVHCRRETAPERISLPPVILERGWSDGVILAGAIYPNLVRSIETLGIPFVAFGNNIFGLNGRRQFDQVWYDGVKGEYEATQYLINHGHRLIAFVGDTSLPWFREQHQGFERAMAANKLSARSLTSRRAPGFVEYGEWAAAELLGSRPRPTAIVAGNDEIAYGLWRSFRRMGVSVPDEVSLVGFDDRELALLMDPPLTTVHVSPEQIGKVCMKLLLERLHNLASAFTKRKVPTKLVERQSVRRAAKPG